MPHTAHATITYFLHCTGVPYNELGGIIEDIIRPKGFSTVKQFCGHGLVLVYVFLVVPCLMYVYGVEWVAFSTHIRMSFITRILTAVASWQ